MFGLGVSRSSSGLDEEASRRSESHAANALQPHAPNPLCPRLQPYALQGQQQPTRTPTLDRVEAAAGPDAASRRRWPAPAYTELPPGSVLWEEYSNPDPNPKPNPNSNPNTVPNP